MKLNSAMKVKASNFLFLHAAAAARRCGCGSNATSRRAPTSLPAAAERFRNSRKGEVDAEDCERNDVQDAEDNDKGQRNRDAHGCDHCNANKARHAQEEGAKSAIGEAAGGQADAWACGKEYYCYYGRGNADKEPKDNVERRLQRRRLAVSELTVST